MLVALPAGIKPISVPNITSIIRDINTTNMDTDGFTNVASAPCPKKLSKAIKIHPPDIIPNIPAMVVKKTASKNK